MKILITGANGQLGKCIKDVSIHYPAHNYLFLSRKDLDITNKEAIQVLFDKEEFDFCINAAAYTHVEKAESNQEKAFLVNREGTRNIAEQCKKNNTTMIQISTDYVFDGEKGAPYTEEDLTNPINVYGASKLAGEKMVQEYCKKHYIIRTSWLYSQYGYNFFNTILRIAKEKKSLTVTSEQTGTPTNANDLAEAILFFINSDSTKYGIYNFSNQGKATWYDFAKEILMQTGQLTKTSLVKTDYYRTFAKRPAFSVLDGKKYFSRFSDQSIEWQKSLKKVIKLKINN
ncbi:dTDP-4-dehydrorhamnose reductase [Flavobacteriaceae bacterium]|nr:dTDP-4-dehydrorhamnose reductase [Flavobacteriaceae bacterium]|tara:strand:- start:1041 stop:1898 length:858 start_codon:yes stop_codon:yes gene_type:complete